MGPTWGPPESCRPQMSPMLVSWTLLSGRFWFHEDLMTWLVNVPSLNICFILLPCKFVCTQCCNRQGILSYSMVLFVQKSDKTFIILCPCERMNVTFVFQSHTQKFHCDNCSNCYDITIIVCPDYWKNLTGESKDLYRRTGLSCTL